MKYELIDCRDLYRGFFALRDCRFRFQAFDGRWIGPVSREIFERGHAVAVLPYDPATDQVVLVEQFRPGALDAPGGPWLMEVVAGMIEPGESPESVAAREMQEESGLVPGRLLPITRFWVSPGGTTESTWLFLALVDASTAGGVHGLADEHEDIRVQVLDRAEALSRVDSGQICAAAPIIALQWLALNHRQLRENAKAPA
ncbi:MAG: NUDIX domain-containing protein [Halothiobacillaceae bacterium]